MPPHETTAETFDHTAPEYIDRKDQMFEQLRACPGLTRSDAHGGFWVASRHSDVREILHRPRDFVSGQGILIPHLTFPIPGIPTESDAPEHTHYRRILWPFLTPAAVADLEPFVRSQVTELINEFIGAGEVEVVEALSKPVPAVVTGRLLGFDLEESRSCYALIDTMMRASAYDMDASAAAGAELFQFLTVAIERATADPERYPVIAAIVNGDVGGRPMTDEEIIGMAFTALGGALETTVSALSFAVLAIGQHPEAVEQLKKAPERVHGAVEEILRLSAPAHSFARTASRPCAVGPTQIEPGDKVLLLAESANEDGAAFEDPMEFRIDRAHSDHMTFGHGVHKCEGQHLARLEIRIVVEELVRRIPDYTITDQGPFVMRQGVCGLEHLRIAFTPGEAE